MDLNFNSDWIFWSEKDVDDKQMVSIPHDAMLHEKRSKDAKGGSATAYFPGGVYFYEKHFEISEDLKAKHLELEFEGIYKNAEIFINDRLAKRGFYGYSQIVVDLDEHVMPGDNTILVKTDNSNQPDSRWYTGAGIYRPVTLHVMPKEHILFQGVKIQTISINPAKIKIQVYHTPGIKKLFADVVDSNGEVVAYTDLQANGNCAEVEIELKNAILWSAENPYLYTLKITGENEKENHELEEKFGIRTLTWSNKGFFVNEKSVKLQGGCVHHDNGILGACADIYAEKRRVKKLKEAGFNAIRSAHNPCSKAMLEACDEYGIYVMDELWDMWYKHKSKYDYATEFQEHYEEDIETLVARDFNHPSVVLYSIGNEVSEPASEKGVELSKRIVSKLHELDSSRAVTAGYNLMIISQSAGGKDMYDENEGGLVSDDDEKSKGMNSTLFNMIAMMVGTGMNKAANSKKADAATSPAIDVLDIAGYNYASGRYPLEEKAHPNRVIFGAETFPQDIAKNWAMVEKYPYLIGDFMWTSWDYLGEAGLGSWSYHDDAKGFNKPYPWLIGGAGAFDIIGDGNGALFLAQAVWGKENLLIGVRPCNHHGEKLIKSVWRGTNSISSWSWKGCNGNRVVVEVFSKAPLVELFLNGSSLGKKKTKNAVATFKIKYMEGTLSAIAYDEIGNVAGQKSLASAFGQQKIAIEPEVSEAKVGETIFVPISIVGENGIVESNSDKKLTVSVEGGELLGFGSANPRTEESFLSGSYTTFYGRSLACIRSYNKGKITIRVSSDDLSETCCQIEIK